MRGSQQRATISQLNIVTVKNLSPIIINNKETVTMENFCHSFLPFDTTPGLLRYLGVKNVLYTIILLTKSVWCSGELIVM